MKVQRMFQSSLLLCGMISILWTPVMPVRAEQIDETVEEQIAETKLQEEQVIQIENITGLDDEFRTQAEEGVLIVEEVEQYRRAAKQKKVQRTIVIVLVIAIFGVGIITGLQEKRKKDSMATDQKESAAEKVEEGQD